MMMSRLPSDRIGWSIEAGRRARRASLAAFHWILLGVVIWMARRTGNFCDSTTEYCDKSQEVSRELMPRLTLGAKPSERTATLIFLHGLGDSGHGWSHLAEILGGKFPSIQFILPHAYVNFLVYYGRLLIQNNRPTQKVKINNGNESPAWYDIESLAMDAKQDAPGIHATTKRGMFVVVLQRHLSDLEGNSPRID